MKLIFEEKHYNIKEVAEILGISTTTVHNYVKANTFKAVKIGGLWHIKESVIKAYLDGSEKGQEKDNE